MCASSAEGNVQFRKPTEVEDDTRDHQDDAAGCGDGADARTLAQMTHGPGMAYDPRTQVTLQGTVDDVMTMPGS